MDALTWHCENWDRAPLQKNPVSKNGQEPEKGNVQQNRRTIKYMKHRFLERGLDTNYLQVQTVISERQHWSLEESHATNI